MQIKFTANVVNTLNISGCIYAKARGKKLIVAICNSLTNPNVHKVPPFSKAYSNRPQFSAEQRVSPTPFLLSIWMDQPASSSFVVSDLEPGSKIWLYLWSRTNGPIYHDSGGARLHPHLPGDKDYTDCLQQIRIFHTTVLNYNTERTTLLKPNAALPTALLKPKNPLPYISGPQPLHFDGDRHRKYLNRIYSYH
ncbi:hypothetical protein C8R46DRAFT_1025907 [Mycena filopes]|nr:hypothetical protein C8R46DRAFT_1025907 [Mycena filopes]